MTEQEKAVIESFRKAMDALPIEDVVVTEELSKELKAKFEEVKQHFRTMLEADEHNPNPPILSNECFSTLIAMIPPAYNLFLLNEFLAGLDIALST